MVNINLRFILDSAIKKLNDLYKYKNFSIIYTNFEEQINDISIYSDYGLFKLLLKNILMLTYYQFINNNYGILAIEIVKVKKKSIKILFNFKKILDKKMINLHRANTPTNKENQEETKKLKDEIFYENNNTQTAAMIKSIIINVSKKLFTDVDIKDDQIILKLASINYAKVEDSANVDEFSPFLLNS